MYRNLALILLTLAEKLSTGGYQRIGKKKAVRSLDSKVRELRLYRPLILLALFRLFVSDVLNIRDRCSEDSVIDIPRICDQCSVPICE